MSRFPSFGVVVLSLCTGVASAQTTLQALQQELNEAKQQQQEMSTQAKANFFSQVDNAMTSADAAVSLWQAAGGPMPDPTPVSTLHETESASERDARIAQDQANNTKLGILLQLHCGVMHFAALYALDPKKDGLDKQWGDWLQRAAPMYAQLEPLTEGNPNGPSPGDQPRRRHAKDKDDAGAAAPPTPHLNLKALKAKPVRDSIIAKYLGFRLWGDKEAGGWSVADMPKNFKSFVLDPSRNPPTATALAYWDVYIGMVQADDKDPDHWAQVNYPPLLFGRTLDEYAIEPDTDKIEMLIKIPKAYPTNPNAPDWFAQIQKVCDDYSAKHGKPAVAAPTPESSARTNSNVSVVTEQQGDAVVITTHTNAAASNAPVPAH